MIKSLRFSRSRTSTLVLVAGLLLASSFALAQGRGGGPGGLGHGYHDGGYMYFDPEALMTLSGGVTLATGEWVPWGHGNHTGGGMGYEFLADDGIEYELMLAPQWFLEEAGIRLGLGERITVTASFVASYDGGAHHGGGGPGGGGHGGHGGGRGGGFDEEHDYLIATAIDADGVHLDLRDLEGYPLWRGGVGWDDSWFDPDSVATHTGVFSEEYGLWSAWGHGNHTGNGMHLAFTVDGGRRYVAMLAPWWFLQREGIDLAEGQNATIRGSVVQPYWSGHDNTDYLVAMDITIDGVTVALRDEWGYPLWPGTGWHYYSPAWSEGQAGDLEGTVARVRSRRNGRQIDPGYELVLRSEGRRYRLFVAPEWEVRRLGMDLARGDRVRVEGVHVAGPGMPRFVVRRIREADGTTWPFRSSRGTPRWVMGAR